MCIRDSFNVLIVYANFFNTAYSLIKNTHMNELIAPLPIDKTMKKFDFRTFFKGIWTGVLISLIVYSLANH